MKISRVFLAIFLVFLSVSFAIVFIITESEGRFSMNTARRFRLDGDTY